MMQKEQTGKLKGGMMFPFYSIYNLMVDNDYKPEEEAKPWMYRLWEWADVNEIPCDDLPRNKSALLALTELILCEEADLCPYSLSDIPPEIGELTHLTVLSLGICGDNGSPLPESLGKLTSLRELYIDNCGPEEITLPESIGNLKQLERLNLSGSITPASITPLLQNRGLRWLHITHNPRLQTLSLTPDASATIKEVQLIGNNNLLLTPEQLKWALTLRDDEEGYEKCYCFTKPDGTAGEHTTDYGQKFQYYCITSSPDSDYRNPPADFPNRRQLEEIEKWWRKYES